MVEHRAVKTIVFLFLMSAGLAQAAIAATGIPGDSDWQWINVPDAAARIYDNTLPVYRNDLGWYRCFVKVPDSWKGQALLLSLGVIEKCDETFFNGVKVGAKGSMPTGRRAKRINTADSEPRRYTIPPEKVRFGGYNLIAVRVYLGNGLAAATPNLSCSAGMVSLEGQWQFRGGDDPAWAKWPVSPDSADGQNAAKLSPDNGGPKAGTAITAFSGSAEPPNESFTLWFRQPAREWLEALPVGNGRMGAMVFGLVNDERIQFNEDTFWSGKPLTSETDGVVNNASQYLPQIRQMIFDGKNLDAEKFAAEHMLPKSQSEGSPQPVGDLRIQFDRRAEVENYKRVLDLSSGIAGVSYKSNGVNFTREVFASVPDNMIVTRLAADQPGCVSFTACLNSPQDATTEFVAPDRFILRGKSRDGLKFESTLRVVADGGNMTGTREGIRVESANSATLLLVAATGFKSYRDISGDPSAECQEVLAAVSDKHYEAIREAHVNAHRGMFDRVAIDLGGAESAQQPLDERLDSLARGGRDNHLAALYLQYGRYLLMASSRPGGQPAHLQGIWNEFLNPPWNGSYTTNINLQMNYWPAEVLNLEECVEPLTALMEDLAQAGRRTAWELYGARGFCDHHHSDIWRFTAMSGPPRLCFWPTGGAWLCKHLWEHYLFTGDRAYLQRVYPVIRDSAQFMFDIMAKDPRNGWLVDGPSNSPEGSSYMCMAPSGDMQLAHENFSCCIKAADILGIDKEFRETLAATLPQLAPPQIGRWGQLQEWLEDRDSADWRNRHWTHLYGFYPGTCFSLRGTTDIASGVRTSLIAHLGKRWEQGIPADSAGTCWGAPWTVALWARLEEGDVAERYLMRILRNNSALPANSNPETELNLFSANGANRFQADVGFGMPAAMAEMLLQSHAGEISLLPALPQAWPDGSVKGLVARGGFVVDMAWKDYRLTEATVHSSLGGVCRVRSVDPLKALDAQCRQAEGPNPNPFFGQSLYILSPQAKPKKINPFNIRKSSLMEFDTQGGKSYRLFAAGK